MTICSMLTVRAAAAAIALACVLGCAAPMRAVDDRFPTDIDLTRERQRTIRGVATDRAVFSVMDADGDGFVTPDEFVASEWDTLLLWDLDGDALISESEYVGSWCPWTAPDRVNYCTQHIRRLYRSLDRSNDDRIGREEYARRALQVFRGNDRCRIGLMLPPERNQAIDRGEARCPDRT